MNLHGTNKSMLTPRKDEGSTETMCCMTDGDPWPVFLFRFHGLDDILICVLHMYILFWFCSDVYCNFFIFHVPFMVEFWFNSLLVVFLLRIVYMATLSYNLCTRQR